MKINPFFALTLLIFSCNYCGKEFIQVLQKRTIKYIMKLPGHGSYIDNSNKPETISLNSLGITSLQGLQKINLEGKEVLDLTNNYITNLDYLTNIYSDELDIILLHHNKIEQVTVEDLFLLQAHFPALQSLNLRNNLLSSGKRKEIRGWHNLLGLTYTIKLREKHAEQ